MYVPERGDAIWINLNPRTGHEQAGRGPAVVLSPSRYNARVGLAIVCPIANQGKGYPFEVALRPGLAVTGVILADHVRSVDWQARAAEFICALPQATVDDVLAKLYTLL
jgi:mRNA interferase MazF